MKEVLDLLEMARLQAGQTDVTTNDSICDECKLAQSQCVCAESDVVNDA